MIPHYLALPIDEIHKRQREIEDLKLRIRNPDDTLHDPKPWFFPPKNTVTWTHPENAEHCVYGYFGSAPIMIVGSRPSTQLKFNGDQAKRYYGMLEKHGLQNAHLTDSIKTEPYSRVNEQVQAKIFAEELRIIRPFFIVAFTSAEKTVKQYLSRLWPLPVCHAPPLPHYTQLRYADSSEWWEEQLLQRLDFMRAWAEVKLEQDEATRRFAIRRQPP